ncbi:MAG: D-alanine--D-alanine ligase [Bacteroidetes bacterium]|nr:D-alanine--D-alanine ligase [Bacteroidota bacterium]MBL6944230.1 D-alanine--D-alanine ligase [Bacteroidales bacterium]
MKNIAVVCGGFSGEYQISVQSAEMVKNNLDSKQYNSYVIVIERDRWYYKDDNDNKHIVDKNDFTLKINNHIVKFDGVFNAIHGTPGEDGKLLGYFDLLNIPYTSCGMDTSALTFNKYMCNKFVQSLGINVARSFSFVTCDNIVKDDVIKTLGLPVFVKPARGGSSVGVSKVKTAEEFNSAIKKAFKEDDRILIEETIVGREITCGLFLKNNKLIVLPLTEIISKHDFFDYEAKYTEDLADEITPPNNLSLDHETDIKAISALLYNKLGCKGVVRIDYILSQTDLYFIEINTVPGMTEASILPKQAEAMGITIAELFNTVVKNMFN